MIASTLAARGARVHLCARTADKLERAAAEIRAETGGAVQALPGDVSSLAGIRKVVGELSRREARLDILVNNAGTLCDAPLDSYPEDGWDNVLTLNLKSCFFLVQQCLPLLRESARDARPATVINIGSVGGLRVGPRETYAYAAAKAGLHHLSHSLAKRLGPENITVNAVAPGFFPSELTKVASPEAEAQIVGMVPRRRMGTAADVGGLAVFLASPAAAYLTGAVIPLDGGLSL